MKKRKIPLKKRKAVRLCEVCAMELKEEEFFLCPKCRRLIIPFEEVI